MNCSRKREEGKKIRTFIKNLLYGMESARYQHISYLILKTFELSIKLFLLMCDENSHKLITDLGLILITTNVY